jgi:hypothetical protein
MTTEHKDERSEQVQQGTTKPRGVGQGGGHRPPSEQHRDERKDDRGRAMSKPPGPGLGSARGQPEPEVDTPRSADTGARNAQANTGATQRDWSGKSPQDMGEDG